MPRRKTKSTKTKRSSGRYVVTATFKLKSNVVTKTEASRLVSKIKAKGGTAVVRTA